MNIRTNLRTYKQDTSYIIKISEQGVKTSKPYLYARIVGTATTHYTAMAIMKAEQQTASPEYDSLYNIPHDPEHGITTPAKAIDAALQQYRTHKMAELKADQTDGIDLAFDKDSQKR